VPTESRWFIKTGIAWLVVSLVLGGLEWVSLLGLEPVALAAGSPAHVHLFVFGWVTQMIIGVALWMFPPYSRERPKGRKWLSWVAYAGINLGLAVRAVAEPLVTSGGPGAPWSQLLLAAAIAQAVGGIAFTVNIWPRVKGR